MTLTPSYDGETPVSAEDQVALTPYARGILGDEPSKADVFDIEQAIQVREAGDYLYPAVIAGDITLSDLLTDHFVRGLHRRLYGEVWTWAGTYRMLELSIGVAPHLITEELRSGLSNVAYRWTQGHWSPQVLGIAAHAEVVRVHPFTDGNGRLTRLLADLVFLSVQGNELTLYDWHSDRFDKRHYVGLLQAFDIHRDPQYLADYIGLRPFGE